MKIKAAVVHETGQEYQIEEMTLDDPKPGEVLIKIVASGICHTDVSAQHQLLPVPLPAVLGHEGAGIIEKAGEGVKGLEPGDHVVLSYASCGHCEYCLTGHAYACEDILEANFGGRMDDKTHRLHQGDQSVSNFFGQSSFATYAIANARNVVKVDSDIDLRLLAPLGCGVQTGAGGVLNVLQPSPGSSIVVFGSGTVGMSSIMAAKVAGCTTIIVVDIHDSRLELAQELGATHTINSRNVNVVDEIKKITSKGVNFAIESTGVPEVLRNATLSLAPMGKVGIIGAPKMGTNVELDVMDLLINVKSVVGIHQGSSIPKIFIPTLINLYKNGQFPFEKLIRFYEFDDINKAISDSKDGSTIKPILTM
ncbi:NAD(P)-dependent alcohol dehydrogenase [Metabacillus litoralis]|jgi:aryl-alcohol dehydrogenase|uniref:NAD(P)-dependent alcohol dehydrogenase n=1 Tax=Metabacillus litoralis TaxID=152268 RepID=UPI0020423854|nr:NAD(P)-dependent alcohol dehydrogenase [Metabacillus litoralis]MCM3653416.1 NAD(P)-dependent alcohol dehydrogenase [Metabacillus litoralis]